MWAGDLQFKSHVGAGKTRSHSWQTYKSVVEENGTINWMENPDNTVIPNDQTFPAPAHLPVFSAILHSIGDRSEEHTSELQSLMRISYAVFCLKKKNTQLPDSKTKFNSSDSTQDRQDKTN